MAAMSPTVLSRRLVRPGAASNATAERTELSAWDQLTAVTLTGRAWGFPVKQIDAAALEAAVQMLVDDAPLFAGRLGRAKGGGIGLSLGSLYIRHSGEGAVLTVAECPAASLADVMGPDTWPRTGITAANPKLPPYIESMDTGRKMLSGREPLLRVRLTRLADGCILGITCCHAILDGMRWPALLAHLGARYRQAAGGQPPEASQLLRPRDRRQLSLARYLEVQEQQGRKPAKLPEPPAVCGSLRGYWALFKAAVAWSRQRMELVILHLPAEQVAELKRVASEGNPTVTTGDAVQAAAALLIHAACGRPPLPVEPKAMALMLLLPTPEAAPSLFNAVRALNVSLPAGTPQPAPGQGALALRQLAGAIRRATIAFRTEPAEVVRALQEAEAYVAAPLATMLSHIYGQVLQGLTSGTNYVPISQEIELGLGCCTYTQQVSVPRSEDMAVIRPAMPPYSPGLFLQLCMVPRHAAVLRKLPLLGQLLPQARFVGCGAGGS